ncbi:MAG: hypothetical protein IT423_01765, partial [Pirellulaceae bacterium]|nr:hypothetical protein [Pirellulaceae bacterium]
MSVCFDRVLQILRIGPVDLLMSAVFMSAVLMPSKCLMQRLVVWALLACLSVQVQAQTQVQSGDQTAPAPVGLRAFPAEIKLEGQHSRARIVFQQVTDDVVGSQVTAGLEVKLADPTLASYADGRVTAFKDGQTELIATWKAAESGKAMEARVPVTIRKTEGMRNWEFEAHVQSVLTRAGCNSGACHGALAGKGGFKLSLRAYDSQSDHFNITRQYRGRRIDAAKPGRSLLLAKPTGLIQHKGGLRLDAESDDYRILAQWIAAGAPAAGANDPELLRIEMLPSQIDLSRDARQQLIVLAHYSNGRVDDVTHWTKFTSANEAMAQVDAEGQVSVIGHGKGSIVATFASRIAIAAIVSPYPNVITPAAYAEFHPAHFID